MMKPTISLCMIAKDEEKFLEQSLNSVKGLVDEIIIVDTGSTDKTKEIAKKFTNKIFDFVWCDDFSAARNESLKHATGEWILVLDADETISASDSKMIRELIKSEEYVGFYLIQRNYINNKSGCVNWVSSVGDSYKESQMAAGWSPNRILRLFKNDKRIRFEGRCHEVVDETIKNAGKVNDASIPIHHYGILNRKELNKANRNIELLEKEINEGEKDKYFVYFQLSTSLLDKGDRDEAKVNLLKSLELNTEFAPALARLGSLYLLENKIDEAERLLIRALKISPSSGVYNNLGIIYAKKKEFQRAIKQFEKAIRLNPKDSDSFLNLGLTYKEMGKLNKAKIFFEKAKELNPEIRNI